MNIHVQSGYNQIYVLKHFPKNDHWNVLYQVSVFYVDRKSKMATTTGHRLTFDPMGKCSNAFFSETTNMINAKLYMNVHWMVPWAVWFQLSKWFQRRSVLKHFSHRVQC
jgi:hypothetical protein